MEGVYVVLLALVATGGPVTLILTRWWDSKDRDDANARQDELTKKQQERDDLLAKNTAAVAASSQEIVNTVKVIHTLVNSNLTESKQEALDSRRLELASIKAQRQLLLNAQTPGFDDTFKELEEAELIASTRIAELEVELADRRRQADLAEAQVIVANKNDPLSPPMEVTIVSNDPVPVRVVPDDLPEDDKR